MLLPHNMNGGKAYSWPQQTLRQLHFFFFSTLFFLAGRRMARTKCGDNDLQMGLWMSACATRVNVFALISISWPYLEFDKTHALGKAINIIWSILFWLRQLIATNQRHVWAFDTFMICEKSVLSVSTSFARMINFLGKVTQFGKIIKWNHMVPLNCYWMWPDLKAVWLSKQVEQVADWFS